MILAKVGQEFEITINSAQKYFGVKGFDVKLLNLHNSKIEELNIEATEVIENISNPATATVIEDAEKGSKTIKISSDSTIKDGMVFSDENNNMYYVLEVGNNEIKTKMALVNDIPYNATLTQVGNTGIYKIPLKLDSAANYNAVISNPSINLRNLNVFIKAQKNSVDDISDAISKNTEELKAKIDEIKDSLSKTSDDDFEVVG